MKRHNHNAHQGKMSVLLFPLFLSGCFWGMFFPSSLEVELANPQPLRVPAAEIHTLALALPSKVESLTGVSDPSRGKLDALAIEIAERLPRIGRLAVLPMSEFHAVLERNRPPDFRAGASMSDTQLRDFLVKSAAAAKADGVLLLHGNWDNPINLGKVSFGRGEYKRQVIMSIIAVPSGETVWSQQASVSINEGIAIPQEPKIRSPVADRLGENLLDTLR